MYFLELSFLEIRKLVFTQLSKIWDFQHDVINAIDSFRIVKEEYLTRSSNNENKKNEERNIDE